MTGLWPGQFREANRERPGRRGELTLRVLIAMTVLMASAGLAQTPASADPPEGPPPSEAYPAVLWMKPTGSTSVARGATIPLRLSYVHTELDPVIYMGYNDASGHHLVTKLRFASTNRFYLDVPTSWPVGRLRANEIAIVSTNFVFGPTIGVHTRNKSYIGFLAYSGAEPFARTDNIDFTKLDLVLR